MQSVFFSGFSLMAPSKVIENLNKNFFISYLSQTKNQHPIFAVKTVVAIQKAINGVNGAEMSKIYLLLPIFPNSKLLIPGLSQH